MTCNACPRTFPEMEFHFGSLNAMQPKEHASNCRASRLAWAVWSHPDSSVEGLEGGVATLGELTSQSSLEFLAKSTALLQAKGPSDSLGLFS